MKTKYAAHGILLGAALTLALAGTAQAAPVELKIATVAPNGSAWMRIFNKMKKKIKKETDGQVKIRFYAGQVQGDEKDVVRKMGTKQLDGGSFTAVGLGKLNPKVLVLQMPMLFSTTKQLDKVRQALRSEFEKSFLDKGYKLLGWGDVGWVYIFSKHPIDSQASLKKQKVWVWKDDPISKAMMKEAGVSPQLLGLPQVYPALNTGMVNAVYNAPLACLTLQWHTKVKYYTDYQLAIAIGATVVNKSAWDKISAENQKKVEKITWKYHRALTLKVRKDNAKAFKALHKAGVKRVPVTAANKKRFSDIAKKVANNFIPRYYSRELLQRVMKLR